MGQTAGPVVAGAIYDARESYTLPILLAQVMNGVALVCIVLLPEASLTADPSPKSGRGENAPVGVRTLRCSGTFMVMLSVGKGAPGRRPGKPRPAESSAGRTDHACPMETVAGPARTLPYCD